MEKEERGGRERERERGEGERERERERAEVQSIVGHCDDHYQIHASHRNDHYHTLPIQLNNLHRLDRERENPQTPELIPC